MEEVTLSNLSLPDLHADVCCPNPLLPWFAMLPESLKQLEIVLLCSLPICLRTSSYMHRLLECLLVAKNPVGGQYFFALLFSNDQLISLPWIVQLYRTGCNFDNHFRGRIWISQGAPRKQARLVQCRKSDCSLLCLQESDIETERKWRI